MHRISDMRVIVLLVACAILGAVGLYCLLFEPAAPLTVVGPALAFAVVVGALGVVRQLLPFAVLGAIRVVSVVVGLAIVALTIAALGQNGTLWIVYGIAIAAIVAALVALSSPPAPVASH